MSVEMTEAAKALLAQVNAHLDYEDDEGMAAAAEALQEHIHERDEVDAGLAHALLDEVDATLDYEDDEDMSAAAEALRDLLPAPVPTVG